ncbi:hypothetical protein V6C03_11015 [Methyloligella sp. 2.7D]|uniref:hypothetical protein n=1 Tax=Methyloligella sp. 2.7D TaxID=3085160 RepID=UPI002FDB0973
MPLLIAVVSAIGLTSALLGDDIWDVLSWATLAVPVAVIAWMVWRPAAKEQGGKSTANNRPAGNKR